MNDGFAIGNKYCEQLRTNVIYLHSMQECNGHRVSASVPRVLVGNKCDLVDQIQVSIS